VIAKGEKKIVKNRATNINGIDRFEKGNHIFNHICKRYLIMALILGKELKRFFLKLALF